MSYETSYESCLKPFRPDDKRGSWTTNTDFLYAGLTLAFRMDLFLSPYLFTSGLGAIGLIPHLILLAFCVVPIYILEMFLGQFSSSGFVSSFRLVPIFKGIGYISLLANCFSQCVYSIFAAIPLFYFINSLRPTLPWSCEYFEHWWNNRTNEAHICRTTQDNLAIVEIDEKKDNSSEIPVMGLHVPSVMYFKSHFIREEGGDFFYETEHPFIISLELIACNIMIWSIIAYILYKFFDVEKFGSFLRYASWTTLTLLGICMVRISFMPSAAKALSDYFDANKSFQYSYVFGNVPIQAMSVFGSSWGSLICLASLNKFRTNVVRSSWMIALGQLLVFALFSLISTMFEVHLNEFSNYKEYENNNVTHYSYVNNYANLYLSAASVLSSLEWPNFWSLLYYAMLVIANVTIMSTQVYTILVSAFDEFINLRALKVQITFGLVGLMTLLSIYFCSSHGVIYFEAFTMDVLFTHMVLYLILILIVLWIYGRDRFQRDFEFMTNRPYATWQVYLLRFLTPIILLFLLLLSIVCSSFVHMFTTFAIRAWSMFFTISIWLFIPGYGILVMMQTTGTILERFKRCCRPLDWYPVGAVERQLYEEALGTTDITHQLHEVGEEIF